MKDREVGLTAAAPLVEALWVLRSGQLDLSGYLDAVFGRIEGVEGQIQALVPEPDRQGRLRQEAAVLQARFPDPDQRPLLYGLLVGVKDIFRVEGFVTRAGSQLPPDLFTGPEAACVTALRAAGALVLGKTATTEFAYFEPGPTCNPYHLRHTPGGSSSGSAAAVAAGYCPLALGTQTMGSVIRPAAFCGVVGLKPSFGRIGTQGLIPCAESADQVGMFTQDVAGMALIASVLCREWQEVGKSDFPVLGVPEGPYLEQCSVEALNGLAEQLWVLQALGYQVRRVPVLEDIAGVNQRHRQMVAAEMARVHGEWFAAYPELYRPRTAAFIRAGKKVRSKDLEKAQSGGVELRAVLGKQMQEAGIDVWVCPAAPGPAPAGLKTTGDPVMNIPWTHAGLPVLSLPSGCALNGLPLGLQCVAAFGQDEGLLAWGVEMSRSLNP